MERTAYQAVHELKQGRVVQSHGVAGDVVDQQFPDLAVVDVMRSTRSAIYCRPRVTAAPKVSRTEVGNPPISCSAGQAARPAHPKHSS
jgi:hypothetical protein